MIQKHKRQFVHSTLVDEFTKEKVQFVYKIFDRISDENGNFTKGDALQSKELNQGSEIYRVLRERLTIATRGVPSAKVYKIEEMIALIWPQADRGDVAEIRIWIGMYEAEKKRKMANPLPHNMLSDILASFKMMDGDGNNELSVDELMEQGLFASEAELKKIIGAYDIDQSGTIDVYEFVKIMTPFGYDVPTAEKVDAVRFGTGAGSRGSGMQQRDSANCGRSSVNSIGGGGGEQLTVAKQET